MNGIISPFPFEFVIDDGNGRKLFLETVEKVLLEDLQGENSFGCKISNCHTHVGSERHLKEFIEAELLFHNSYYNKGFALLTAQRVIKWLETHKKEATHEKILLVGYENYSELYLCETADILNKVSENNINAKYCIYENIGKRAEIRKLESLIEQGFFNKSTKIVFIIPISTTFTTLQKLVFAFQGYLKKKKLPMPQKEDILNIALIVIAKEDGFYWKKCDEKYDMLDLDGNLFGSLSQRLVHYFSFVQSEWYPLEKCPLCFPDLQNERLVEEKPLFGVNRTSVVPMLQLEKWKHPAPFENGVDIKTDEDIRKVIRLSRCMYHKHLQRNGNHFQYYFDMETFFDSERELVNKWLKETVRIQIKKELLNRTTVYLKEYHAERLKMIDSLAGDENVAIDLQQLRNAENHWYERQESGKQREKLMERIVYDFLVAPRHYSNAAFVHAVNEYVFDGTARIFYFDVQREYRGNINAKYSDFQRYVSNIKNSRQYSLIRFHFVDDTIYSSGNFMRAKSLISTLTGTSDRYCEIQLYASVILLMGRNSKGTQKYLLGNAENFFEYVHLSISPMRNHEDACTLCLLSQNFQRIKNVSAMNNMNLSYARSLESHELHAVHEYPIPFPIPSMEMRLRLIIAHFLLMRVNNQYKLLKKDCPINREDGLEILQMLEEVWENFPRRLKTLMITEKEAMTNNFQLDVKVALIKVITRPFWVFHIRQKQAAFSFCMEKTEALLTKSKLSSGEMRLLKTLVNGLADMDANYILRQSNMTRILKFLDGEDYFKAVKKLIVLSQGDTKALLLEALLTSGNEQTLFEGEPGEWTLDISLKNWFALYMENNQILIKGFQKWKEIIQASEDGGYGINNFRRCFEWNGIEKEQIPEVCSCYCEIVNMLTEDNIRKLGNLVFAKLEERINELLNTTDSFLFVADTEHSGIAGNEMDKYILLNDDASDGNEKLYNSSSQQVFDNMLSGQEKCMEIGNTFVISYAHEFYIIKIVAWNQKVMDSTEKSTLYIALKERHAYLKNEEKSVRDCKVELKSAMPFLFRLKILMSLRNQFEMLIQERFGSVIELVRREQVKRALSISKATGHGVSSVMQSLGLNKGIRMITQELEKKGSEQEYTKEIFDKYIQILANNFISEIYRMIHTGELCNAVKTCEKWRCSKEVFGKPEYMIFLETYLTDKTNEPKYEFWAPRDKHGMVKVTVKLNMQKEETWILNYLARVNGGDSVNFKIVVLMACNAAFHSISEDRITVDIYKDGRYLCFRNAWELPRRSNDEETNIKLAQSRIEALKTKLEVHPSRGEIGTGISLWSLKRYCELLNDKETDSFVVNWEQINKEIYFVVKMKLFME